jgi:protein-disulfide isomerase
MAQNRKTADKNTKAVAASRSTKKSFFIGLAVAAIAGIAALTYISTQAARNRIITLNPNLPPVESQGYVMGSPNAKIELIEFGDFECPGCGQYAEWVEPDIRTEYVNTGKIRFRFIDFPLVNAHRNTLNASNAAACGDEQGKFWEMHDRIFATRDQWSIFVNGPESADPDKYFRSIARQIPGIDGAKFDECLSSRRNLAKIQSHLKLGETRGVGGTPTFQLGNQQFGNVAIAGMRDILDKALAAADSSAKPAGTKPTNKP